MREQLRRLMAEQSLNLVEKAVLVCMAVDCDDTSNWKVEEDVMSISTRVGLDPAVVRAILSRLEHHPYWIAWSGGTKKNGNRVVYLDAIFARLGEFEMGDA